MTRSFDVLFDLRLNKPFSTQSRHRWFDTPSLLTASYGVSVLILKSDSLSPTVITVPYGITRQIGPRHNGTCLYSPGILYWQQTQRHKLVNQVSFNFYALNCSEGTKHIFTFYVIPSDLHDTGSWNPSLSKTRTLLFYIVNIMVANRLATQGARASPTMIFILLNRINSVPVC